MKPLVHLLAVSSGLLFCALAQAQSQPQPSTADQSLSKAEAAQLSQDMSPKARSQLARREAHAAYREAVAACKSMGQAERKGCAAEAKSNLNKDLKYAKDIRSSTGSEMSMGGSGDSVSGANDLSSAGSSGAVSAGSSGASPGSSMSGVGSQGGPQSMQQSGMSNDSSQASAPLSAAEKKQFEQSFTPQAQYNLAKREAYAAHAEAMKACKALDRAERSTCNKDAKTALQQDLARAKQQMKESAGASSNDSGMSGTGSR